ncbi:uncharacterized protein K489DRAFT_46839 [Dissoconium aciculare CBS 342.82]|uniref:Uncharacterized protein n=1 Tax=Dissoconium aciculare CBS 342.82 TaxID=1314786 RepID=A0A6J3LWS8_9PEZI|nr:uncharacterized protein K489DRAFT_46839 [Dissoconium aciculare CBS 342.82]KAF1820103.1 hypothetical protein K489DRAFT_46839 [Dissoconium aciculare CBS 342.82]
MSNDILSCQPLLPPCLLDLKVHRKRMRRIDRRTDRQTKDKGKQKSGSSAIEKHHRGENSKERTPEKSLTMMSERASAKCPIGKLEAIRLQSFFLSVAAASLPACQPARPPAASAALRASEQTLDSESPFYMQRANQSEIRREQRGDGTLVEDLFQWSFHHPIAMVQ